MKKVLLILAAGAGLASAGCLPVTGSRILGSDLAQADPRFGALPATLTVGFAPTPGAQRVYHAADLERIARANGIAAGDFAEICFEIPMRHFAEADAVEAMRRSLPSGVMVKIVESARLDVPAGTVEFPLEGIEPPGPASGGLQLWRGYVKYAEARRMAVWARVELSMKMTGVVTDRDLPQDVPISASALRIQTSVGPFERIVPATRIEEVAGRIPKRALKAGSMIPLSALAEPPTVRRGDSVPVVVESGMARVRFDAIAESSGRDGEIVELRNPANGKTFKARLDGGPRALIVIAGGRQL